MALILSLETSTVTCSVALHEEGALVADATLHQDKAHSRWLAPMVSEVMKRSGYGLSQVQAIAVSGGPGSYTGLRIGTSLAKGLCYGLSKPLLAVDPLASMANHVIQRLSQENSLYCAMMDARRMEVFMAVYDTHLQAQLPMQPVILDSDRFPLEVPQNLYYFGDGSAKAAGLWQNQSNFHYIQDVRTEARHMGLLAFKLFQKQQFADLAYFEPDYGKAYRAGKPKSVKSS